MTAPVAPSVNLWDLLQQAKAVPAGHTANALDLADAIEAGLPIAVLRRLMLLGVLEPADVTLIMPVRTFQHRKATRSRLTIDESDRVVRLAHMTVASADALGDMERGKQWLRTANPSLRGARPLDLLRTSEGTRVVEQILGRISHGIGF